MKTTMPRPRCSGLVPLLLSLAERTLVEVSGIAPSRRSPGLLWMHNDSGDQAVLYAGQHQIKAKQQQGGI